ncbi:M20 metallopeptidase family protein [Paenibacillus ginsengarvi]|uniref:Amidohydrolase n=1 Tax=Paenibacillus ginsengarvi TaxID=400777 RepID=A0A3B0CG82_9BACL|nr:M20 family metallopeptidase [Paenibacillus ginsengarvi]RKN83774.1 amidohydrolase [Paenibacillus ginsengarvi]
MKTSDLLLEQAKLLEPELIELRRDLHRHPELSFQESRTAGIVARFLQGLGLEVREQVGGFGVVADLRGASEGPTVALRADMDALPITEETGLDYASGNPGVMHACGHDIHTSVLLGAARLLASRKAELRGTVRFLFQSAEEILAGANTMIERGVMDGVDEIYGLHNLPFYPAGTIGLKSGVLMGSIDRLEIRVDGKGGHGGYPETCIDPIVAASAVVAGLQSAVSREAPPTKGVVVSIGTIHGGTANNIIPDFVELTGTVRNLDPEWRETMPETIERIVSRICEAYRCRGTVRYIRQVPPVWNDTDLTGRFAELADRMLGSGKRAEPVPMTYGEDFAEYLRFAKGCFFWLGSGPSENAEQAAGLHSPRFNPDEGCLAVGAALLAGVALDRLA